MSIVTLTMNPALDIATPVGTPAMAVCAVARTRVGRV